MKSLECKQDYTQPRAHRCETCNQIYDCDDCTDIMERTRNETQALYAPNCATYGYYVGRFQCPECKEKQHAH